MFTNFHTVPMNCVEYSETFLSIFGAVGQITSKVVPYHYRINQNNICICLEYYYLFCGNIYD